MRSSVAAAVAALLALCMLALTGCALIAAPEDAAPVQPQITETPLPEPAVGGTLFIPMPLNPSSIDPLKVNTKEMKGILSLVFENVVNLDQNNRLVPGVAETWEAGETGEVWRLMIRKGVRWHGTGEELTADDIVYTYETIQQLGEEGSIYFEPLKAIDTIYADGESPYTLIVQCNEPGYSALYGLNFPVVSRKYAAAELPVGTGPYRVRSYQAQTGMELTANEQWWRQPPYIKTVMARAQADPETALAAVALKQLNFMTSTMITAGRYRVTGETDTMDIMTQQGEFLMTNLSNHILADIRVRKAIALALDRREIVSKVYLNHAVTSDVPIPPDSWLYDIKFKVYDQDAIAAAALLEEAGWKDRDGDGILDRLENSTLERLALKLLVNETPEAPEREEAAKFVRDQLARVGIEIEIITRKWLDEAREYQEALETGNFALALVGVNMGVNADLYPLIGSEGARNYGGYRSASMDELLRASQRAVLERDVAEAYLALQQKIVDELPVITLYFHTALVLYDANIIGIKDIREHNTFRTVEKWYFVREEAPEDVAGEDGADDVAAEETGADVAGEETGADVDTERGAPIID